MSRRRRVGGPPSRSCEPDRRDGPLGSFERSGKPAADSSSRPFPGYGIAQVCRSCGRPAACAACGGVLRSEEGVVRCVVCEAPGRCAHCGATDFGLRRGGAERVEEWAASVAPVPVRRIASSGRARLPRPAEILVGGPESVRDLGTGDLELVAILDADLAERRPGIAARERALATWMEAVGVGPAGREGHRAGGSPERPGDPGAGARQPGSVPCGRGRASEGGGVPGRIRRVPRGGQRRARVRARRHPAHTMLASSVGDQTVCLLALDPGRVSELGRLVRELAARDVVARVEAEPHL